MPGEVDHRKQQIADFGRRVGFVGIIKLGFDFVGFLADFGQHGARVVPVETDAAGLGLKLQGAG